VIDWADPDSWNFLLSVVVGMYVGAFLPVVALAVLWWNANKR
jgi:hypothetical protein